MTTADFPKEFTRCPTCHGTETVARKACEDEPSVEKGVFVSLGKEIVPITTPSGVIGAGVKCIIVHYDVCWKCGTRYAVKAEKAILPTKPPPVLNINPNSQFKAG